MWSLPVHVLVRTDNTATVAYINHQGGLRSRRMSQLARHLLLWSQKHLRSLRAIVFNCVADELSRAALTGEWRFHPPVVQLFWGEFGEAHVDLFALLGTSHCQLFSVQMHWRTAGCTDLVQSQGGRGAGLASCALLAQPDLVPGTHAPRDSPSLASSSEKGPSFSETGHPLAPVSRPL